MNIGKELSRSIRAFGFLLAALTLFPSCGDKAVDTGQATAMANTEGYRLTPLSIRNVTLTDKFWLPVIERVQEKTIAFALEKCREEGRFENFLIAGGQMEGETRGAMPFDDTDVYKIIEGASNSLISAPNPELETLLDSLISIIAVGQEADGYLTTWRTINPAKPPAPWVDVNEPVRWDGLNMSHELYNAGHLYEAAAVHYEATGKKNLLDIALKNADLMVRTFGDGEGMIRAVPGHQIIETGLIKLYRITDNEDYLRLARYYLDRRGDPSHHELWGDYLQDHKPVTQQDEVLGHAVRAVYMYAGMTDIAALQQDTAYLNAVHALWDNMVTRKMYLTGGIGARHDGEAFGENYELPNLTAYSETCAAIGDVYWNHRLHNLTGDVKYTDVLERTLYNGLLAGISLSGTQFFYPNALESDGVYTFNRGACTRQDWFDCSCCPTNLIRFLPAMPGLIYSQSEDELYVNLYAANRAVTELAGRKLNLEMETGYPRDGKVRITLNPEEAVTFTLMLRVPGWSRNEVLPGGLYSYVGTALPAPGLWLNGEKLNQGIADGYLTLSREWQPGDQVELEFPMQARTVVSSPEVVENQGKMALEYGPIVYAVEAIDNPGIDTLTLAARDAFTASFREELLGGVTTLSNENLTAIPYYAWSNRGIGKMKVWLPRK